MRNWPPTELPPPAKQPMSMRPYIVLGLWLVALWPCAAKETVYFKTGSSLEVDSHVLQDRTLILQMGIGTLQFSAEEILKIEPLPDTPVPAHPNVPPEIERPEKILSEAAYLEGLDEEFVRSVAKVESGLRQEAVSPKGAVGLMQLMPATAAELGVNANRAADNAHGGAKYLRDLLLRYHGNSALALAAYNAGPGAVSKYNGVPPYPETRRYILLVLREYERQLKQKPKPPSGAEIAANAR